MTWTKLSDSFVDEMDGAGLDPEAAILHVAAMCYCNRLLTDGHIPKRKARSLYALDDPDLAIKSLLNAGYWAETDTSFEIVDFLEDQRSAETIRREQGLKKERQSRWYEKKRAGTSTTSPNGNSKRDASQDASRDGSPAQPSPALKEGAEDGVRRDASAGASAPSHPSERPTTTTRTFPSRDGWEMGPSDMEDEGHTYLWTSNVAEIPFVIEAEFYCDYEDPGDDPLDSMAALDVHLHDDSAGSTYWHQQLWRALKRDVMSKPGLSQWRRPGGQLREVQCVCRP